MQVNGGLHCGKGLKKKRHGELIEKAKRSLYLMCSSSDSSQLDQADVVLDIIRDGPSEACRA